MAAFFFFQAEDGIRDRTVTGVQTCALPISDGRARLGRLRPILLFVCLDRRRILRQPQLKTDVRVHMTIGDVMGDLAHRPPAGPVRRIELRGVQSGKGTPKIGWSNSDLLDARGAVGGRECIVGGAGELPDGIPLVRHWSTRQVVVNSVVPHLMRSVPRSWA